MECRPQAAHIRSRILTIAFKYVVCYGAYISIRLRLDCIGIPREKMKIPANVIDQLITGSQSDIRQVLNMLSTWKLSSDTMDFDAGKNLYVGSLFRFRAFLIFTCVGGGYIARR